MSPKGPSRPGAIGKEVSAIIRERMGRQRIIQADIVHATGIDQGRISRMLSDQRVIQIDELALIAGALGVDAADLLRDAMATVTPTAPARPPARDDLDIDVVTDEVKLPPATTPHARALRP